MSEPAANRLALCAGVVVADHLAPPIPVMPGPGELATVDSMVLNIGGLAANASIGLAKLGASVNICGRVGPDAFGPFVAQTLRDHGVNADGLHVDPDRPTSQTLILNIAGEDRRFIHCFGANAGLNVADLRRAVETIPADRELAVFYLGGYLILPGIDPHELAGFLKELRGRGIKTVLDIATPGPGDYLPRLRPVLPEVDVFLPNEDEARLILPDQGHADAGKLAETFHQLGAGHVVITRGGSGCVSVSGSGRRTVGTYPVTAIDGTGGGDAFDAGYILGLLEGKDEVDCLRFASAAGASCVRALGATAGLFTSRAQLEDFLCTGELSIDVG